MPPRDRSEARRERLELFRALPGALAARDTQDLMAYPFFSLAKSPRFAPIEFSSGGVSIRVDASAEHGMATIRDADVLIWATSQIVEARDAGLRTSRLIAASPHEILTFVGRGVSSRDYQRFRAALDRLQSTTIVTSLRQQTGMTPQRFSWIETWTEIHDEQHRARGIEIILADWFYQAVLDDALVLTIDRAYFQLTGSLERWLYRLVRKHGGRQRSGWRFDFQHLYCKSASLSPFKRFAFELRDIIHRQPLPGYRLSIDIERSGRTLLAFEPEPCGKPVKGFVPSGTNGHVLSGTGGSCHQEPKPSITRSKQEQIRALNLESNIDSNINDVGDGKTAPDARPAEKRKERLITAQDGTP